MIRVGKWRHSTDKLEIKLGTIIGQVLARSQKASLRKEKRWQGRLWWRRSGWTLSRNMLAQIGTDWWVLDGKGYVHSASFQLPSSPWWCIILVYGVLNGQTLVFIINNELKQWVIIIAALESLGNFGLLCSLGKTAGSFPVKCICSEYYMAEDWSMGYVDRFET